MLWTSFSTEVHIEIDYIQGIRFRPEPAQGDTKHLVKCYYCLYDNGTLLFLNVNFYQCIIATRSGGEEKSPVEEKNQRPTHYKHDALTN